MAIGLKTKSDIEVFPYGTYPARLKDVVVEKKQPDTYHSEAYEQLCWVWEMKVPGHKDPVTYRTWTSLSLSPKSHLPGLLKALGVYTDGMESFEPEDLKGMQCQLLVEEQLNSAGEMRNKTKTYIPRANGTRTRAAATTPSPAATPAPAPVAAPDAEEDVDPFESDLMDGEAF